MVSFTQSLLPGLLIYITLSLFILIYLFLWFKKWRIAKKFGKLNGIAIIGLPKSGKSVLVKQFSGRDSIGLPFHDEASYVLVDKENVAIYDTNLFYEDGRLNYSAIKNIKSLRPKIGILAVDVSRFSKPVEEQLVCLSKLLDEIKFKKIIYVATKADEAVREKLKKLKKEIKDLKIIRNKRDLEKFKQELLKELKT